jgi:hypothetical protein
MPIHSSTSVEYSVPTDGALEIVTTDGAMLTTQEVGGTVFVMILRLDESLLDDGPSVGEVLAQGEFLSKIGATDELDDIAPDYGDTAEDESFTDSDVIDRVRSRGTVRALTFA